MQPIQSLAACATVLVIAAGCAADPSDQGQEPLTAAEFRAKAQKICRAAEGAGKRLGDNLGDNPTKKQVRQALGTMVVVLENEIDDLDHLVPPAELQDDVDAMLASVRRGTEQVKKRGMQLAVSGRDVFKDANKKAKDLGLDECAD